MVNGGNTAAAGNVWNAITYDPDYNHIYLGTGNGSPWNRRIRSPGGGDNLFLCAIVALDADTGKYKWHYQTVPGETWDFNSAMDIVSVDLKVHDREVKALMHAPKNGFFYVINRSNGKLLSAKPFAKVTWASEVDMKSGRPIEVAGSRYGIGRGHHVAGPFWRAQLAANVLGARQTTHVLSLHDLPGTYNDKEIKPKQFQAGGYQFEAGVAFGGDDANPDDASSGLMAWDPVTQSVRWKVANPGMWHGGTMVTKGNLVFQGRGDGLLVAYRADNGEKVWHYDAKHGISAPPITFALDGRQFIALPVGWGGSTAMLGGSNGAQHGWVYGMHPRRLLVFALDGETPLPATPPPMMVTPVDDPKFVIDAALSKRGEEVWTKPASGATARARSPVAARPTCVPLA